MKFSEKLKAIRKQSGMSQEKLAEKLGVSRQAISKWETDAGIPDIENMMAISTLFNISIDEFLADEINDLEDESNQQKDFLFESITEYDIDRPKRYDMNLGGANTVVVTGYDGEKIRVRLASDTLENIQSDFKLKIDDVKNCIDLDMARFNNMTEAAAKESLLIFVWLPRKYVTRIELAANAGCVKLRSLECESIEYDGKTANFYIDGIEGTVEINCNLDMDITCHTLEGAVEINQISATSRICVPVGADFNTVKKGIGNSISYERDGNVTEPFNDTSSENIIELNGIKSELVIYTSESKGGE